MRKPLTIFAVALFLLVNIAIADHQTPVGAAVRCLADTHCGEAGVTAATDAHNARMLQLWQRVIGR